MDFGDVDSGNAAIFRGDSCYRFKYGHPTGVTINNNEGLIFLIGGMFFYPLDRVYTILDTLQYNLKICRKDQWQGSPVFVIGQDGANQLWLDSEHLYLVRLLKRSGKQTLDARFDNYQPFQGGICSRAYLRQGRDKAECSFGRFIQQPECL